MLKSQITFGGGICKLFTICVDVHPNWKTHIKVLSQLVSQSSPKRGKQRLGKKGGSDILTKKRNFKEAKLRGGWSQKQNEGIKADDGRDGLSI